MENNFKEILPNGLESYDGLEDQMDEDGDFQLKKDPSDNDQDSNCSSKSATKTNKTKVKRLKSKSAFKCRLCEKVCSSFYKLQRHMSSHGMNKVKCNLCDKSISFKDHLEVHLKGKHPEIYVKINKLYSKKEAGFPCEGCSKTFDAKRNLEKHIKTHDKAYQCSECPTVYHSRVSMRRHLYSHKEEAEPQEIEKMLDSSIFHLKQEVSWIKNKADWILSMMENGLKDLKSEDEDSDYQDNEEEGLQDDNLVESDNELEQSLQTKEPLDRDTPYEDISAAQEPQIPETNDNKCDINAKYFSCNFCSKEFFLHHELKSHVLHHIAVQPFECNICNETFTTRKWIKLHSLSCNGVNRRELSLPELSCQDCDIYFEHATDQFNHQKIFHEDLFPIKEETEDENTIADNIQQANDVVKIVGGDRNDSSVLKVDSVHCKQEIDTAEEKMSNKV